MSLQALLAEVDPAWHDGSGEPPLPVGLRERAGNSALGRRLLAGALASGPAPQLLAPVPGEGFSAMMRRWPRPRVASLQRDLGALAFAPAIRNEIGRDVVRRLKTALGNSYLLALDRTVWEGKVDADTATRLDADLRSVLASGDDIAPALFATLDRQGRAELQAWTALRDLALGEWTRLLQAPAMELPPAHLPEKPVLVLHTHHLNRAIAG